MKHVTYNSFAIPSPVRSVISHRGAVVMNKRGGLMCRLNEVGALIQTGTGPNRLAVSVALHDSIPLKIGQADVDKFLSQPAQSLLVVRC
jgi:hypothetical protein